MTVPGDKKEFIGFILIITLLGGYLYYDNWYREKSLKNTCTTWAVVTCKTSHKTYNAINIFFYAGKEKREVSGLSIDWSCYRRLAINDTIEINYSIADPEVVEISKCYWPKKY